jgi:hypothetical protein
MKYARREKEVGAEKDDGAASPIEPGVSQRVINLRCYFVILSPKNRLQLLFDFSHKIRLSYLP